MITTEEQLLAKATIERLLHLSDTDHNQMIYDFGLDRLARQTIAHSVHYQRLESSPSWWNWWKRDWNMKNYQLLVYLGFDPINETHLTELEYECLREAFYSTHSESVNYPSKILAA